MTSERYIASISPGYCCIRKAMSKQSKCKTNTRLSCALLRKIRDGHGLKFLLEAEFGVFYIKNVDPIEKNRLQIRVLRPQIS